MEEPFAAAHPAAGFDLDKPSTARIYDYLLGGTNNWAIDRLAVDRILATMPWVSDIARANRAYLQRAVRYCLDAGISQFVDLGSGIPTVGNVHEVADSVNTNSRVVYVDNEAVAFTHGKFGLEQNGDPRRHRMIQADLRDPEYLWNEITHSGVINPKKPIAVLAIAVLHFISDDDDPQRIVSYYRDQLPAGSALAISHYTQDGTTPEQQERGDGAARQYLLSQNPIHQRDYPNVKEFFGDFELVEPGLVYLPLWRPNPRIAPELKVNFEPPSKSMGYAGVARKPA